VNLCNSRRTKPMPLKDPEARKAYQREYQKRTNHAEKERLRYHNDPEVKERMRQNRQANLERYAEYARNWRAKNPERAREIDNAKRAKQPPGVAAERTRQWRLNNPEKARESSRVSNGRFKEKYKTDPEFAEKRRVWQRENRAKDIERVREYNARWHRENRAGNPQKVRNMHLKSLYGLTVEDYEKLLAAQNGMCAACSRTPADEHHKVLHVDHCHETNKVRGLLCTRCNTALGLLREDPAGLQRYIAGWD
jgi:hypothetical protein